MTDDPAIASRLEAWDRAATVARALYERELNVEIELVDAGESTIQVWRLEPDAGAGVVSVVGKFAGLGVDAAEMAWLLDLAARLGVTLNVRAIQVEERQPEVEIRLVAHVQR